MQENNENRISMIIGETTHLSRYDLLGSSLWLDSGRVGGAGRKKDDEDEMGTRTRTGTKMT